MENDVYIEKKTNLISLIETSKNISTSTFLAYKKVNSINMRDRELKDLETLILEIKETLHKHEIDERVFILAFHY
ncbi:hypothetical protein BHU72_09905 [Desulfuribacillus stibiiarsenatis]|uniref:Uncharacterized protein n=1 Tax=Desulfuribacillus stibiiarsenatis TaxID=1390249 RepID=A0A1E5L3K0_9FIRM|nr:hypothetical protein [Desulfuribacillus stibiiarsenatis]OEH84509.1 hypothetical protein BHU72_09905 [Desulfuribacillus stibiiarsenatis]